MAPISKKHNKVIRSVTYPLRFIMRSISPFNYVKIEYRYITGHKLNLTNPTRYTEKLQHLRLIEYPNNPLVSSCASRTGLREYAKNLGFEANLINIYGIFDKFDDIDFAQLPKQFVLKCNHASGFNFICYNKDELNLKSLRKKFNKWLKTDYGKLTVEPHYSPIERKIIVEELMLENNHLPTEYKIHVFNGKAKYMYVVTNRDKAIHYNNYLIKWAPFEEAQFNHWTSSKQEITKPENWDDAVLLAEKLSEPFPFVRVDLYIINKKIYISEMTFTPAKGTLTFAKDDVDIEIGNWLDIKK